MKRLTLAMLLAACHRYPPLDKPTVPWSSCVPADVGTGITTEELFVPWLGIELHADAPGIPVVTVSDLEAPYQTQHLSCDEGARSNVTSKMSLSVDGEPVEGELDLETSRVAGNLEMGWDDQARLVLAIPIDDDRFHSWMLGQRSAYLPPASRVELTYMWFDGSPVRVGLQVRDSAPNTWSASTPFEVR